MRIGGLASGMDIDSIVEKLMLVERQPLDKLEQQKQTYEWQRDAYRDINTKLKTFDTYLADNYFIKSMNAKSATISDERFVSATATNAATGTLTIDKVERLATAARMVGNEIKVGQETVTGSTTLGELFDNFPDSDSQFIEIKAIQKNGSMADEAIKIEFNESMTIDDFVKKLNSSEAGVTAIFENGRLSITANNTGVTKDGEDIVIESGAVLFEALGVNPAEKITGTNAIFSVNGIETERTSNSFNIAGYSITLKGEVTEPVTLTSSTNLDDMVDRIKDFVKTYNELITDLNNKVNESKYRDYKPLTSLQRKEMEDKEIELWEEKAKSGLLRGDSIIREGIFSMRSLIYQSNPAISNTKFNTLFSIGITTSKDYMSGGTLEIDENKLRAALEEDPDAVVQLFTFDGDAKDTVTVNGTTQTADTRGFLRKLRAEIDTIELKIEKRAGRASMNETQFTLGNYLRDINKRIDSWQDKLVSKENQYWRQFTEMEKMISKANSQSAMLMGQFYQ